MQISPGEFDRQAAPVEDSADALEPVEGPAIDHRELEANADQRKALRRNVDKAELRLAFRDLAEGVRGLIRVAPLTAVLAGAAVGVAFGASRTRPAKRRARAL